MCAVKRSTADPTKGVGGRERGDEWVMAYFGDGISSELEVCMGAHTLTLRNKPLDDLSSSSSVTGGAVIRRDVKRPENPTFFDKDRAVGTSRIHATTLVYFYELSGSRVLLRTRLLTFLPHPDRSGEISQSQLMYVGGRISANVVTDWREVQFQPGKINESTPIHVRLPAFSFPATTTACTALYATPRNCSTIKFGIGAQP